MSSSRDLVPFRPFSPPPGVVIAGRLFSVKASPCALRCLFPLLCPQSVSDSPLIRGSNSSDRAVGSGRGVRWDVARIFQPAVCIDFGLRGRPLTTTNDFSACPNKNGLSFRRAVFVEMRHHSRNSLKDQRWAGSSCFHSGVVSLSVFHADGSEMIPVLPPVSRLE